LNTRFVERKKEIMNKNKIKNIESGCIGRVDDSIALEEVKVKMTFSALPRVKMK
jgi:hypothetical protein